MMIPAPNTNLLGNAAAGGFIQQLAATIRFEFLPATYKLVPNKRGSYPQVSFSQASSLARFKPQRLDHANVSLTQAFFLKPELLSSLCVSSSVSRYDNQIMDCPDSFSFLSGA